MPFDWKEYLSLAEWLQTAGAPTSNEAVLRCAVSRAYYAVFCCTRNYAQANLSFVPNEDARDHARLRRHLTDHRHGGIATKLQELCFWRDICDYEDDSAYDLGQMWRDALARAKYIMGALKP